MIIEQIYTGCLAQGAYYIESNGEAVVIDPLREVSPYLNRAHKNNVRIRYILETHFHADFVSGHIDLARQSGGTIVFGPGACPTFDAHVAKDGEVLQVGAISFEVIHTPGHTMESICYLLRNEEGKQVALFTGDTLFIGDVGRPDLAQQVSSDLDEKKLAGLLFESLRNKISPLSDDLIIYPAHGAGSACGKKMSSKTYDTLGNQKKENYALNPNLSREEFMKEVISGLTPPPAYFPQNVLMNMKGYESINEVVSRGTRALDPAAFEAAANETSALILDTRDAEIFSKGFIPNSINIGLEGSFAPWVGSLITDIKQTILLVTDEGKEEETVTRLARVGYDHAIGYLHGGFAAWKTSGRETDQIKRVNATELSEHLHGKENIPVFDVRKKSEYESEHMVNAANTPLDYLNDSMTNIPKNKPAFVHCAGGYRSMIFISALRARGYNQLMDVRGGFHAIKASGLFKITDYVCPTTLL
jgi:glyoxylase-like metal-dependent hydrolase (beta-lactamase superfamily II)/rhodanese-related sulfurtransferase